MYTKEKVVKILMELSGKDIINDTDDLQQNIGLDSLGLVTMLLMIEDVFNIQLKESDMNPFDLNTVLDVIQLVERY